ncbi:MAG: hypothetical protein K2N03_02375 [Muribaculaceae bacterium]|nr:hypothetical protein [Muribaculaceae bacterium]
MNERQLETLNARCNIMPLGQIKKYIASGQVTLNELTALKEERRRELERMLNDMPNPEETGQWGRIQDSLPRIEDSMEGISDILSRLDEYIVRWKDSRPNGNHLEEAMRLREDYEIKLRKKSQAEEEADWERVWNEFDGSTEALLSHRDRYPYSAYMEDIDDGVWNNLVMSKGLSGACEDYIREFPDGLHVKEVEDIRKAAEEWEDVKYYRECAEVKEYISNHSGSPFLHEAEELLNELKREEIEKMKGQASAYESSYLLRLVDSGVFSERELVVQGVIERGDIQNIRNIEETRRTLPDILTEIANCRKECLADATDVFFFGIPSTGKSCILMGLTGTDTLNYNAVKGGGPYAAALNQYLVGGITVGQTPGDFIATIPAEIVLEDSVHPLNLVEMSGEEFAFKLAGNEEGKVSFEDMGTGASQLLRNSNRKVFFIIIDPTTMTISFNHDVPERDADGNVKLNADGNPIMMIRKFNINQRITLKKLVDVLMDPDNKDVMEKVDAINFIVTKADVLDRNQNGNDRESEAYERFVTNFGQELKRLIKFCAANGINITSDTKTNGHPRLYTFSLGRFKVGGFFTYDSYDSEKLVQVIKENTVSEKDENWWGKFLGMLNRPLF